MHDLLITLPTPSGACPATPGGAASAYSYSSLGNPRQAAIKAAFAGVYYYAGRLLVSKAKGRACPASAGRGVPGRARTTRPPPPQPAWFALQGVGVCPPKRTRTPQVTGNPTLGYDLGTVTSIALTGGLVLWGPPTPAPRRPGVLAGLKGWEGGGERLSIVGAGMVLQAYPSLQA